MSIESEWKAMYERAIKRERAAADLAHERRLRVITLEGQRQSMLAHLRLCIEAIGDTSPCFVAQMKIHLDRWRTSYVEEETRVEKILREARGVDEPVHGHPRDIRSAPVHTEASAVDPCIYRAKPF